MEESTNRFLFPLVFIAIGVVVTYWFVSFITARVAVDLVAYDPVGIVDGRFGADAITLILWAVPVYILEFLILTFPIATVMIVGNRVYRAASYNQSIVPVGHQFGGIRMIRRALIPALFALSFSELILGLFPGSLLAQPEYPTSGADRVALMRLVEPSMAFLGAILALTVAIAIYSPIWLLNDAGVVSHLKQGELEIRRPPDTEGVGKWFGGFISGFALLAYPITVIYKYVFFLPSVFAGVTAINYGMYVIESLMWIFGLPLLAMTYILPVIMLNEILLPRTSRIIQRIARSLGASDITQEVEMSGPLDFGMQE